MAKTTKDTAKEWIEGLRELSKELMDDSKEHRKEANEHKKQATTLTQIEDGIKETLNIKAEGGQIDFDSVVDTGQPHDMLKKGGSIKEQLKKKFNLKEDEDIDTNYSDLYVRYSPEVKKWLDENLDYPQNMEFFTSQIDKTRWIDIPFGNYAQGGMIDLYIDELRQRSGMSKVAMEELVENNKFTKDELANIMVGIDRDMIKSSLISSAFFGGKSSKANKDLVKFANSNKAFKTPKQKLAKGGEVRKYKWVESDDSGRTDNEYSDKEFEKVYMEYRCNPNWKFTFDGDSGKNAYNEKEDKRIAWSRKYDFSFAKGGKLRTNSKEVREKIREHIKDSVYDENEEEFETFGKASKYLVEEFKRVADYPYNQKRIPNNQERFEDYLRGIPFHFEYENYKIEKFLNSLGINPENKEYDSDKMWRLYGYLIWKEIEDDYYGYAKGGSVGNKEYELKSWYVDVYEDSWEQGELDNVHNWSSSDYQDTPKTFDSKEELEDYIQEVIERSVYGHDFKNEYLDIYEEEDGEVNINYSATASYDDSGYGEYNEPTKEELENWKKDNQKLFAVRFSFRVEVYEKSKLSYAKGGLVVGDYVEIVSDNDSYDDFRDEELIIESISDDGYGETMYELSYQNDDTEIPFSFYEYELEKIYAKGGKIMKTYDDFGGDYDEFTNYVMDRIDTDERRKIRKDWNDTGGKMKWQDYLLKRVNEKSYAKGGKLESIMTKKEIGIVIPKTYQIGDKEFGNTYKLERVNTKKYRADDNDRHYNFRIWELDKNTDLFDEIKRADAKRKALEKIEMSEDYGTGGFLLGNMLGGYLGYKLGKSMEQDDDVFGSERKFAQKVAKSVGKKEGE